jgi:hypothetical protein
MTPTRLNQYSARNRNAAAIPFVLCRSVKADADRFARNVAPIIREIQSTGVASHRGIARSLNARGVATARGGQWTAVQVSSILRHKGDFARQLHSSSNGGSLEQGRIDGLLAPPPLDAAMPLGVAALLDVDGVDTLGDP